MVLTLFVVVLLDKELPTELNSDTICKKKLSSCYCYLFVVVNCEIVVAILDVRYYVRRGEDMYGVNTHSGLTLGWVRGR
jgi:hypothetical protein